MTSIPLPSIHQREYLVFLISREVAYAMKLLTLLLAFASSGITSVTPPPAKPVLYASVCPTAGECAFVKTIANDCRQLSTPLYDI
jgi:hypothetical protein